MSELKRYPYSEGFVEVRKHLEQHPEHDTFDDLDLRGLAGDHGLAGFSVPGHVHVHAHDLCPDRKPFNPDDWFIGRRAEGEPREYTLREEYDRFMDHIAGLTEYWSGPLVGREGRSHREHLQHCVSGMAHSFLSTLSGSSASLPGYFLIPYGTEEDKQYMIENGCNYSRVSETLAKDDSGYNDIMRCGNPGRDLFDNIRRLRKSYTNVGGDDE